MKKLFLKLFPYDKLQHFTIVGMLPTMVLKHFLAWWTILLIVLLASFIIEWHDKKSKNGNAEIMDIVYALVGAIIVIILK